MSVKDKLLELSFDEVIHYDLEIEELFDFLNFNRGFEERQDFSILIIKELMTKWKNRST